MTSNVCIIQANLKQKYTQILIYIKCALKQVNLNY